LEIKVETKSAIDEPWHIYTDTGTFHSGYSSEQAARHNVRNLNEAAEKLGVKARYVVEENHRPSNGVSEDGADI
jgi:hypothetical protein